MMNEQISAWVDGEVEQGEARQVVDAMLQHDAQRQTCELYWMIGDALRGLPVKESVLAPQVMRALASEPTVLAPRPVLAAPVGGLRWMPMAAAVAGVAVAAWMGLSMWAPVRQAATQPVALGAPPEIQAQAPSGLAGEQAYFMAHQASAVGAPMAGVAQYIRAVSDERVGGR